MKIKTQKGIFEDVSSKYMVLKKSLIKDEFSDTKVDNKEVKKLNDKIMEQLKLITNLEIQLKEEIERSTELRDEINDSDRLIEIRDKTIQELRSKARSKFGLEEVEDSFESAMRNELQTMR